MSHPHTCLLALAQPVGATVQSHGANAGDGSLQLFLAGLRRAIVVRCVVGQEYHVVPPCPRGWPCGGSRQARAFGDEEC